MSEVWTPGQAGPHEDLVGRIHAQIRRFAAERELEQAIVELELRDGSRFALDAILPEPGYGFVDDETPELAIAVVPSKRGHGIGDELLQELIAKAKAGGYGRLSLSVEPGNPARKLYERHGFEVVDEGAEAWTMVASLS